MKICIFTHTLNSHTGAGEFSNNLINGLKKIEPNIQFSILTSEDYLAPGIFSFLRNFFRIRRKIKDADIVHALDAYPYGVIAALVNLGINKPLVITAVGSGSLRFLKNKGIRSVLLKWSYNRATKITDISNYVAGELNREGGFQTQVINHGVDRKFWAMKEPTRLDGYIQETKPYVLTVGEMKKRKGYSLTLPIMKEVIDNAPEVKYVIVSNKNRNTKYWEEILLLIKDLGLEQKVKVLSDLSIEELRAVYQGATAYLLMPQNIRGDVEGFGLSVLEASAAGTPVVVGQGSGADDAVSHGGSGFLVGSPEEAIKSLNLLIKDDGDLRRALLRGAKNFTMAMGWDKQISKYNDIYRAIIL